MGKVFEELDEGLRAFIAAQQRPTIRCDRARDMVQVAVDGIHAGHRGHLLRRHQPFCPPFRCLDDGPLCLRVQMPDTAAAGSGEQPQLPLAGSLRERVKHRCRVCAGSPFRCGPGRSSQYGHRQSAQNHS